MTHVPADYGEATKLRNRLEATHKHASRALQALSGGGPMGLTPGHVRAAPEWQAAKREADAAFEALRSFNETYVRRFRREIAAERRNRRPGYEPNEDLAWREVYARSYQDAEARGLQPWQAREEASRTAWGDYEARTGATGHRRNPPLWESDDEAEYMRLLDLYDDEMAAAMALEDEGYTTEASVRRRAAESAERAAERITKRYAPNGSGYYVWALARGSDEPLADDPWGPYDTIDAAKTFARIGATEGTHDRAVSIGLHPQAPGFRIVRRYEAGSGERLV